MSGSKKRNELIKHLHIKKEKTKKLRTNKIIEDTKEFVLRSLSNTQLKDRQDLHNWIVDIICNPTDEWKKAR